MPFNPIESRLANMPDVSALLFLVFVAHCLFALQLPQSNLSVSGWLYAVGGQADVHDRQIEVCCLGGGCRSNVCFVILRRGDVTIQNLVDKLFPQFAKEEKVAREELLEFIGKSSSVAIA